MNNNQKKMTEDEIDEIVTAEADNDLAWERPIRVRMVKGSNVPLPAKLAARAAFFASLLHDDEPSKKLPISRDHEILSGETVFRGTRVPVLALLDNIAAGITLDEFLDNFPTVRREQVAQVLEFANHQ